MTAPTETNVSVAAGDYKLFVAAYLLAQDIHEIVDVWLYSDKLTPEQKQRVMAKTVDALIEALDAEND